VTAAAVRGVAEAYVRWGKGRDRARLNFGDCFAYALAKERDCALLFVGEDFAKTDVTSALPKS
jgi:ribonuclease VapC